MARSLRDAGFGVGRSPCRRTDNRDAGEHYTRRRRYSRLRHELSYHALCEPNYFGSVFTERGGDKLGWWFALRRYCGRLRVHERADRRSIDRTGRRGVEAERDGGGEWGRIIRQRHWRAV
jgi:hypothetical protein